MPTSFMIDKKNGVVYRRIWGIATPEEMVESYGAVFEHPDFRAGMLALTDMRDIEPTAAKKDILKVVSFVRKRARELGEMKVAYVVATEVSFEKVRGVKEGLEETGVDVGIFRTMESAIEWLGLPADWTAEGLK